MGIRVQNFLLCCFVSSPDTPPSVELKALIRREAPSYIVPRRFRRPLWEPIVRRLWVATGAMFWRRLTWQGTQLGARNVITAGVPLVFINADKPNHEKLSYEPPWLANQVSNPGRSRFIRTCQTKSYGELLTLSPPSTGKWRRMFHVASHEINGFVSFLYLQVQCFADVSRRQGKVSDDRKCFW